MASEDTFRKAVEEEWLCAEEDESNKWWSVTPEGRDRLLGGKEGWNCVAMHRTRGRRALPPWNGRETGHDATNQDNDMVVPQK